MDNGFNIIITPRVGDQEVYIPMTLDVPKENGWKRYRGRLLLGAFLILLLLVFSVTLMWTGLGRLGIIERIIGGVVLFYLGLWFVRVVVLEENQYRKDLEHFYNKSVDFRMSDTDLWGIFSIERAYPPYVYFKNGQIGLFVLFEKNVRVGRDTEQIRYDHYQSVADAYREVGKAGVNLTHIDYMSNFGDTARIQNLFRNLEECDNEDLRDLLSSMYSYLETMSQFNASTYDVYMLSTPLGQQELWAAFTKFQANMMQANYISYNLLGEEAIRSLTVTLFNLEDFSAVEASRKVAGGNSNIIIPTRLIREDGSEVILRRSAVGSDEVVENESLDLF